MILAKLSRRQEKPSPYNTELRWFSRAFRQPKTRREFSPEAIDKFKAMIWDNPSDDMPPSYGKFLTYICRNDPLWSDAVVCRLIFLDLGIKNLSQPMATYFEKEYTSRLGEWATCFRIGTRANTNMFVESFHRTLKEVYLERKQNRRVDHLLSTLRKIARDKAYEQWIKAEKGKVTIRQRERTKRHRQAGRVNAKQTSIKTGC